MRLFDIDDYANRYTYENKQSQKNDRQPLQDSHRVYLRIHLLRISCLMLQRSLSALP